MSDGKALGFIETVGLAAAIAAADAALKAANVKLVGRENSKGQGCITVKIVGDVGAVKAAIDAAKAAAGGVSKVWATLVIPRPAEGLGGFMIWNGETRLDSPDFPDSSDSPESEAEPKNGAENTENSDTEDKVEDRIEEAHDDETPAPQPDNREEEREEREEREEQNPQTEQPDEAEQTEDDVPAERIEQAGREEPQPEPHPRPGKRGKNTKKHGQRE
jgi:microcompartment protein CcmL/EutN